MFNSHYEVILYEFDILGVFLFYLIWAHSCLALICLLLCCRWTKPFSTKRGGFWWGVGRTRWGSFCHPYLVSFGPLHGIVKTVGWISGGSFWVWCTSYVPSSNSWRPDHCDGVRFSESTVCDVKGRNIPSLDSLYEEVKGKSPGVDPEELRFSDLSLL